jgi:hypothetical protein
MNDFEIFEREVSMRKQIFFHFNRVWRKAAWLSCVGGLIVTVAIAQTEPTSTKLAQNPADAPASAQVSKTDDDPRDRLPELPAREVMKYAQLLHFKARSRWYNAEKLERELLKRKEFGELGLEVTREEKYADLVIEVTRKKLTTRFTCTMLEPHSKRVVGGTTASSLGGEVEPHLADALIKEFKAARLK